MSRLLTIPEVAKKLELSVTTTRRLIQDGGLPVVRLGGQIRIAPEKLDDWIDRGGSATGARA